MAEIVLFHSALGLRPAIHAAAEHLRAKGHVVHVPDYYAGKTFDTVEAGVAERDAIGFEELPRRWHAAVESLPKALVYVGWSLGGAAAALLAATRPGARGAVLLHGALTVEQLGVPSWPAGVPMLLLRGKGDPWVDEQESAQLRRDLERAGASFEEHVYPSPHHLFDDPGLEGHDPQLTRAMWDDLDRWLARLG